MATTLPRWTIVKSEERTINGKTRKIRTVVSLEDFRNPNGTTNGGGSSNTNPTNGTNTGGSTGGGDNGGGNDGGGDNGGDGFTQ